MSCQWSYSQCSGARSVRKNISPLSSPSPYDQRKSHHTPSASPVLIAPLSIIVFAILTYTSRVKTIRTRYLPEHLGHGLDYTSVQLWQEVQLTYSLITATLPFVLGFMRNFDTNINNRSSMSAAMILGASKLTSRTGTAHSKQGHMERRGTVGSQTPRAGVIRMPSMPDDVHKWDRPVKYEVKIYSADGDRANPSEDMIIRRNDTITVHENEKV